MLRALIGFLCLCFSTSAQAKLGETVPQLIKRFGSNYTIESDTAGKRYKFRSDKLRVDVLVSDDASIAETYFSDKPLTASGEPPNDIVREILKTNVPQSRWSETDASPLGADYALRSSDQKHIAFLRYRGPQPEGSVWTLTIGEPKMLSSWFSTATPSPVTSEASPLETPKPTLTPTPRATTDDSWSALQKQLQHFRRREADIPAPTPISGGESKWEYQERPDEMGRGVMKFAHVDSLTTLNLGFPYQGPQLMRLVLQSSPQDGKGAYIKVDHGNSIFATRTANLRFDSTKVSCIPSPSTLQMMAGRI